MTWLPEILNIAHRAGSVILDIYNNSKDYEVKSKLDSSPVTKADIDAHTIIVQGLQSLEPTLPVLSEEGDEVPFATRQSWEQFWLVDPLDGTREFIKRTGEFTVNIALISNNRPILGVVVAPTLSQTYWAIAGQSAYYQHANAAPEIIKTHSLGSHPLRVAVSRTHHDLERPAWKILQERLGDFELVYCGSALKMCLIAAGKADLYPRFGITKEWDTAAGQCILEAAGGCILDFSGNPLQYNRRSTLENPQFVALSDSKLYTLYCG